MPLQLSLITDQRERPPQCQPRSAKRLQPIQNQWLVVREETGDVGDGREQQRGMVMPCQMSAVSILEVQFDNNVQFLPESKILPPAGFTFREENPAALWVKGRLL